MNTDACLLGALASVDKAETILDIGTGTGVIALMLAQRFENAQVEAIELVKEVYDQANLNFKASPFKNIKPQHVDFLDNDFNGVYDLIVCNPPYFSKHLQRVSSPINTAIHNQTLEHGALLDKVKDLLKERGSFFMILPTELMQERLNLAINKGLHPFKSIEIFNKPGKSHRMVVEFKLYPVKEVSNEVLVLTNENGERSEAFSRLMFPYYLDDSSGYR